MRTQEGSQEVSLGISSHLLQLLEAVDFNTADKRGQVDEVRAQSVCISVQKELFCLCVSERQMLRSRCTVP